RMEVLGSEPGFYSAKADIVTTRSWRRMRRIPGLSGSPRLIAFSTDGRQALLLGLESALTQTQTYSGYKLFGPGRHAASVASLDFYDDYHSYGSALAVSPDLRSI